MDRLYTEKRAWNRSMKGCSILALFLTCLLSGCVSVRTADYYVAPDGSDRNSGTKKKPFSTVTRARDAVREKIKAGLKSPLTVELAGGVYHITEPITFGPEDSGAGRNVITYAAASGEQPVISGGRLLKGWKQREDGLWELNLPAARGGKWPFRQLFVNGERRTRARYPNADYLRVGEVGPDGRTSFTFKDGDLPDLKNWEGTELVFLHDWSISRVPVKSVDHVTHMLVTAEKVGPSAKHFSMDHFEKQPRYFVENSVELIDAPGEWFLDTKEGVLYYKPMPGEKPDDVEVVAPVSKELLSIEGDITKDRVVSGLVFRGLSFEHCAWYFPGRYAAGQAAFHEELEPGNGLRVPLPAAVQLTRAEGCSFVDCNIARAGGSGIWIGAVCSSNSITRTHVFDIGGNGVLVGEDNNRHVNGITWWQAAPGQVSAGNRVEDCLIERCGRQFYGAVGVWSGMTRNTIIRHNEIRFHTYTGVSLGWIWNPTPSVCGGNIVEGNHIHHIMQILSDGGGIYTLGKQPGTVLRGNLIHDVSVNIGRAESNGMFLDEGTTDLVISENVIYNIAKSPLRFHKATTNIVRDNILVTTKGIPHIRYNNTKAENITQQDNIVVEALPEGTRTSSYGPRGGRSGGE